MHWSVSISSYKQQVHECINELISISKSIFNCFCTVMQLWELLNWFSHTSKIIIKLLSVSWINRASSCVTLTHHVLCVALRLYTIICPCVWHKAKLTAPLLYPKIWLNNDSLLLKWSHTLHFYLSLTLKDVCVLNKPLSWSRWLRRWLWTRWCWSIPRNWWNWSQTS